MKSRTLSTFSCDISGSRRLRPETPRPRSCSARDLLAESVGAGDRRVLVVLPPQHQGGDAQLRELALVRCELREVAGAVQLQHPAATLLGRKALPVLVDGPPVEAG